MKRPRGSAVLFCLLTVIVLAFCFLGLPLLLNAEAGGGSRRVGDRLAHAYGSKRRRVSYTGQLASPVAVRELPRRYRALTMTAEPPSPYRFQVPFVMQDGVPLLAVRVLSQATPFVCVADTGSMHLNISASTCRRCDKGYGFYEPTVQMASAPSSTLVYGTQHDQVKEVPETMQLHRDGRVFETAVHVTVRRDKAYSNYNVFGMLDGRGSKEGIADAILGPDHSLLVRFNSHGNGRLIGLNKAASRKFVSQAPVAARLVKSSMGFYMVRVTGVYCDDVPVPTTVKLAIVDTGSNMTSFPRATFRALAPRLARGGRLTLEFDGKPMHVSSSEVFWKGGRDMMLDDDLTVLGRNARDYMILGSHCMQSHQLLFTSDTLAVAPISAGKLEL